MNLVLADCEEFRVIRLRSRARANPPDVEQQEKRLLGLVILRGSNIMAYNIEGPPPADPAARLGAGSTLAPGPGISKPIGRGAAPSGLLGPAAGAGPTMGPPPGFAPPGGFPNPGFPGPGRGGPPRTPFEFYWQTFYVDFTNIAAAGFSGPPQGFSGPPPAGAPPGFGGPGGPGFQGGPPGPGRGYPPPGFGGR